MDMGCCNSHIHTYMNTYIHEYIHTYIQANKQTNKTQPNKSSIIIVIPKKENNTI